jgi:hypothetical protein
MSIQKDTKALVCVNYAVLMVEWLFLLSKEKIWIIKHDQSRAEDDWDSDWDWNEEAMDIEYLLYP